MTRDQDDTPTSTLDERGATSLLRDRCRAVPDPAETGRTCPACAQENGAPGDGVIRIEHARGYSAVQCALCGGALWVTAAAANEWEAKQRPPA